MLRGAGSYSQEEVGFVGRAPSAGGFCWRVCVCVYVLVLVAASFRAIQLKTQVQ